MRGRLSTRDALSAKRYVVLTTLDGMGRCEARLLRQDDQILEVVAYGMGSLGSCAMPDREVLVVAERPFEAMVGRVEEGDDRWARIVLTGRGADSVVVRDRPRVFVGRPAKLEWQRQLGKHHSDVQLHDLALGGCSVLASKAPRIGRAVRVAARLDTKPIELLGNVVRATPGKAGVVVGIAFGRLDPASQAVLIDFLNAHTESR
jgi:hypothetical protein